MKGENNGYFNAHMDYFKCDTNSGICCMVFYDRLEMFENKGFN